MFKMRQRNSSRPGSSVHFAGAASSIETPHIVAPRRPEKAPARLAHSADCSRMLAVPILVIVGTMLCLTGLGRNLGVPMILAAVFGPAAGSDDRPRRSEGQMPLVRDLVSSVANAKDFDCHACGKRICHQAPER